MGDRGGRNKFDGLRTEQRERERERERERRPTARAPISV